MRRYIKLATAAILAASLIATPVFATEEVSLEPAEPMSAEELAAQQEAAEAELEDLRNQLADLITQIDETEQASVTKAEEIAACEADLAEAEEKESRQYEAMKLRIKYMYEYGGGRIMQAILNSEDIADALNKAEYSNEISQYDREMILEYIATENEIQALKETKEQEQTELMALKALQEDRQHELDELVAQKEQEVADFADQYALAIEMALAQDAELQAAVQMAIETGDMGILEEYQSSHGSSVPLSSGGWAALMNSAYSWLGTPYLYGGSSSSGIDCSGFVQAVYASQGISIPRTSGSIAANGTQVSTPQQGDILWRNGHVAIYVDENHYIDSEQDGTVIEVREFRGDDWSSSFEKCIRYVDHVDEEYETY